MSLVLRAVLIFILVLVTKEVVVILFLVDRFFFILVSRNDTEDDPVVENIVESAGKTYGKDVAQDDVNAREVTDGKNEDHLYQVNGDVGDVVLPKR